MLPANRFAFKEWAVVCEALTSGRQTVILRKGGIHEGREGFRVEHGEFWLFPTRFHQQAEELIPDAAPLLERVRSQAPPEGTVRLSGYAVVDEVIRVVDESRLAGLTGLHVWSEQTVAERFHYRSPGLFALLVRVHRHDEPLEVAESPHFAGCRSWVDLPEDLSTSGLRPVLSAQEYQHQAAAIRAALSPGELA